MLMNPTPKSNSLLPNSNAAGNEPPKLGAAATQTPTQIAEKQMGTQPPTHEQIAARAYEKFLSSGGQTGQCSSNWTAAETELKQQAAAPGGLDKASTAASMDMSSEGAGGAVGDSAHSGVVTKPFQPATQAGKFSSPSPLTGHKGR